MTRVLSLGGGVQSSAIYRMMCEGYLPPAEFAIFADTGCELPETLKWLDKIENCKIPIHRLKGDLLGDLERGMGTTIRTPSMPLWTYEKGGKKMGPLHRQCTEEYKLSPIRRKIRELLGKGKLQVEMVIGISRDEYMRMKPSNVQYIKNAYPLVEKGITRDTCKRYLLMEYGEIPPRSSCIVCPYHTNDYWKWLRDNHPVEFQKAVEIDRLVRNGLVRIRGECYLHPGGPLEEQTFGEEQLGLGLENECMGICGV